VTVVFPYIVEFKTVIFNIVILIGFDELIGGIE